MPGREARWTVWGDRTARLLLLLGRSRRGPSGRGTARGALLFVRVTQLIEEHRRVIRPLRPGGVLRYELGTLHARALWLPGLPPVRRGDPIVILHWNNEVITETAVTATDMPSLLGIYREVRRDLQALARLVEEGVVPADVRAVWAETLMYRALSRVGFKGRPASPGLGSELMRVYMIGMVGIYGRQTSDQLASRPLRSMRLGEAWIGIHEVVDRYGSARRSANAANAPDERAARRGAERSAKE